MATRTLAVQLYSVRDRTEKDLEGTLKQVAALGYQAVELAGFGNCKSAEEAAAALRASGLAVCGAHIGIEQFESDLADTIRQYKLLGCSNLVVPWLPQERRTGLSGWKQFAKSLNDIGQSVKQQGLRLGYHNHSFEFALIEKGVCGMDILLNETDPAAVSLELDCFWVVHGGRCPACFIRKHASRLMTLHLKDMSDPVERKFANVGTGLLDFPSIVAAGTEAGVPWFIVEQDNCYGQDTLEAVKTSMANLKAMQLF